jgi:hypothetical protein
MKNGRGDSPARAHRIPLKAFYRIYPFLALFSTVITGPSCEAARLSPRTALVAPMELSNKAQLHTKFTVRIDGKFWIEVNYVRKFRFSAEHPAPFTEFSAHYIIEEDGKIVQQGGFTSHSNVPAWCLEDITLRYWANSRQKKGLNMRSQSS